GAALIFSHKARTQEARLAEQLKEVRANLLALFTQSGISCELVRPAEVIGDEKSPELIERYLTLNFKKGQPVLSRNKIGSIPCLLFTFRGLYWGTQSTYLFSGKDVHLSLLVNDLQKSIGSTRHAIEWLVFRFQM
ncbi:hypothetical protein, partial [Sunxiuqinia indica]|uniref:hypothetical protein n=1 Tax=Sunxiuqinia indica TaxID=2692584 RepID=UPI001F310DC0